MALRAEIRTIQHEFARKLPLEPEGPVFRVSVAKVFLEGSPLGIRQAGGGRRGRQLSRPVGRPAAGPWGGGDCAHGIRGGGRQSQGKRLSEERVVTDLIAA